MRKQTSSKILIHRMRGEIDIRYYSIVEVAGILGVSANKIRIWEKIVGQPNPKRTNGKLKKRLYLYKDILVLIRIKELMDLGLKLKSVKAHL